MRGNMSENEKQLKYKCPCCGFYTLPSRGDYEICPVCFWEDDGLQSEEPDCTAGPNGYTLNEAKENFKKYGAMDKRSIEFVRPPKEDELFGRDK